MSKIVKNILILFVILTFSFGLIFLFKDIRSDNLKGNITIWANSINFEYLNNAAQEFMQSNPRCKIGVVNIKSYEYEDKVDEALKRGDLPNIIQMDTNRLFQLPKEELSKISLEKDIIETYSNNFSEARIQEITNDAKILGIPFTSRPLVLYLRQDMMDEYGYKHENINTWEQLIEMGKDIFNKSDGKVRILNSIGQDKDDLISLLIMQAMEEYSDKEEVIKHVKDKYEMLDREGIINNKEDGAFLARISSINGMRELAALQVPCNWTANNIPAKQPGGNRFYTSFGDNLIVVKRDENNSELIRRFMGYLITNTKDSLEYISNGEFFLSFLSVYKDIKVEEKISNFTGKSPIVIMANITEKAPKINNYKIYREIRNTISY